MSNYTTGEMAKLCNVSVRTVQFYDTKGILPPSELTKGGRRIYNEVDLQKLQLICTLKTIGLSLNSIKNVLESEWSGKILTMLLEEQVMLLTEEISERQKQLEMIAMIKRNITDNAMNPANTLLGIEDAMEKREKARDQKKLVVIYVGVAIVATLGFLCMVWLIKSQIWWGLALYLAVAILGLSASALQLKDAVLTCPKCDGAFKPSLRRKFFSTGDHRVRWINCPECGEKHWCVLQKPLLG